VGENVIKQLTVDSKIVSITCGEVRMIAVGEEFARFSLNYQHFGLLNSLGCITSIN
jgi:hypothetical protein